MSLDWIHENPSYWDDDKANIVGGAPQGIFDPPSYGRGDLVAGEWWRVEDEGRAVGYGWLDHTWGDAEILLAVAPSDQGRGVGSFIIDRLEKEAADRGLNYMFNVVRPTHPDAARVMRWLENRRFTASEDGMLKRRAAPQEG